MATAYSPPGVVVSELASPSVNPLLAVPASICLVGRALGYREKTEAVTLVGTTAQALTGVPSDATMATAVNTPTTDPGYVAVRNATDPSLPATPSGLYTITTDYTVDTSAHTITRVGAGAIADGTTVYVTYRYTDADYFVPIRLDSMADIEARFGAPWNAAGTAVNSRLSFGAQCAFENGASTVVLAPIFTVSGSNRVAPSDAQAAATTAWTNALVALRDLEDINVIIPITGQSDPSVGDASQKAILTAVQAHVRFMRDDSQQYLVAIWGYDDSASSAVATQTTIRTDAATFAAQQGGVVTEQIVFINIAKAQRPTPQSPGSNFINLGSQYMAASVAGMLAARPVSEPLTRKVVSGWTAVTDARTKSEKNLDAAAGLMVIEQRGGNIIIRHATTLNTTGGTLKKELSVVRAKHRVIESVRDTIETQIIGNVVADGNANSVVKAAVVGVLAELVRARDIVSFSNVQARTLTLDPTAIEVRFSYLPALPVNYVNIVFSLDLTSGEITIPTTQASTTF